MTRIITGLIAAAIWCLIIYINSFPLIWAALTLFTIAALWEYINITLLNERITFKALMIFFGSLPVLCSISKDLNLIATGLIAGFILTCVFTVFTYSRRNDPFGALVHSAFASIYISFCTSFLVMLMTFSDGALLLLLLLATVSATDSGAYFVGKKLGRRKLAPNLSPGKTIAGLMGGFLSGVSAALIVYLLFLCHRSMPGIIFAAVLLVGLGTIGDLTESIIKRGCKVKDSGSLLPGHGGVLDRFDSLLLSGPLFYYLIYWGVI
ncbi:MAG: phosphatidate cytidylyltransferase [Desulfurivibrionaceae bacterium]